MPNRVHKGNEGAATRSASVSLSLSTPFTARNSTKARLSNREIVLNATSWPRFLPLPPPFYSFAPSTSFLSPIYRLKVPSTLLLLPLPLIVEPLSLFVRVPRSHCSTATRNMCRRDGEYHAWSRPAVHEDAWKRVTTEKARVVAEVRRNASRETAQNIANNAWGFRQSVQWKWSGEPARRNPALAARVAPCCVRVQHAFGFMGLSGRKSDLPKTKRGK